MNKKTIYVTEPSLPALSEFIPYLESIWESKRLTNGGPFHQQLERELCEFLGVKYISLFTNATIALITALQALKIKGEVITTPYSFVATSHSILWNGLTPVFVDIDPVTYNIDPQKIEAAITPDTTAIMPVHCYGNPCDVEAIEHIAQKHGLKVIYDAAHAFGINYKNSSLLNFGDLSILSFHATKVFNTFEGGAIICHSQEMKEHIDHLKNFGFVDETTIVEAGINGKMSEVNAAFGLLQLKHVNAAIAKRAIIHSYYRHELSSIKGIATPTLSNDCNQNYSYFPILVGDDYVLTRDELYEELKQHNIKARRYFYPLISNMKMYNSLVTTNINNLPIAGDISIRVLCLPIYADLDIDIASEVVAVIKNNASLFLNHS